MSARTWIAKGLLGAGLVAGSAGLASAQAPAGPAATPPAATPAAAAPGTAQATGKPPAVVNNEPITMKELDTVMKMLGPIPVQVPEAQRKQMRMHTLAIMIDELLIHQYLRQHGPQIPDADVEKRMAEWEAELKKEKNKTIADICKEHDQTREELKKDLMINMQLERFILGRLTDQELQRAYTEYKDYFDGVTVRASHIVLRLPPNASETEKAQAKQKLTEIRGLILAGKVSFADAAKEHSNCPSAKQGGDLGYFPRKFVVEEAFARAAFALPVGNLSDVVQTDYGLHLILVTDRKPGQPSDFAKIKDAVRAFCAEDIKQQILQHMRKNSKVEVNLE
jgi:parvulin-like peptidyl-prolyl isomerase